MFSLLSVFNIASMKRVANFDKKGSPGQGLVTPQNFHSLCAHQLEHPARNIRCPTLVTCGCLGTAALEMKGLAGIQSMK